MANPRVVVFVVYQTLRIVAPSGIKNFPDVYRISIRTEQREQSNEEHPDPV
jgi:hypothetical protein